MGSRFAVRAAAAALACTSLAGGCALFAPSTEESRAVVRDLFEPQRVKYRDQELVAAIRKIDAYVDDFLKQDVMKSYLSKYRLDAEEMRTMLREYGHSLLPQRFQEAIALAAAPAEEGKP